MTPEQRAAIVAAIYAGNKIEAIKLTRAAMGGGLAESKEWVEKVEAELRLQHPEKFTAPPKGKGCVGLLAGVAVVIAGVIYLTAW